MSKRIDHIPQPIMNYDVERQTTDESWASTSILIISEIHTNSILLGLVLLRNHYPPI